VRSKELYEVASTKLAHVFVSAAITDV
jgi:hypothetical protein